MHACLPIPGPCTARRVTAVHEGCIDVQMKDGSAESVPFRTCL